MADQAASGSRPPAYRGNGISLVGTDTTGATGATRADSPGPATITTRGLSEPSPGPEIVRETRPRVARNKGDVGAQKARARARVAGAAKAEAPEATRRSSAGAIQSAHADAALMLGLPELELSAAEAARVASAFERTQELTGFAATGPMWDWLYVGYVLACVYLKRAFEIVAKRRAAAADAEATPAAVATHAPAPVSPLAAPLPAPIAGVSRTSQEQSASTGELRPTGAGNPSAATSGATQESIAAALAHAAGTVAGFEKRAAGLPVSSIDERMAGI